MRQFLLLALGVAVPVFVARGGSSYIFAASVSGTGVVFCLINAALITFFVRRRAPEAWQAGEWEMTAGTGVVPRWVSELGLVGIGLIPGGIFVALLVATEVIAKL